VSHVPLLIRRASLADLRNYSSVNTVNSNVMGWPNFSRAGYGDLNVWTVDRAEMRVRTAGVGRQ